MPQIGSPPFIVIPPDTQGAVGLDHIFTTLNNNYVVQSKTTGAVLNAVSMVTFWSGIGATDPFDPRVEYDPYNNRWILSAVSDAQSANSSVLVGVSQTGDPAGLYFTFRIDADNTDTNWADFPVMGFNKNWVAINVNTVAQPGPAIPNKAFVFDYTQLRTGVAAAMQFNTAFCASPVITYSATENTLYVITHLSSADATYRIETITGTPAVPAYTQGVVKTRPGGGWTFPSGQILPQAAPLVGASACVPPTIPCRIETQDAFVRANAVFRNNNIYYAQTVGLPAGGGGLTHTAAQWTKVDTSGNFVDGGRIEDPTATATNGGKWYAYPSIAVNKFDEIIVGFTEFSSAQFASAGYTFRSRVAGAPMGDPFIYKAGEDYYHKTFGGSRNRWGDYSAAQVDPSDDAALWTLQEYAMARVGTDDGNTASNSSRWSTWWAKLGLAPTAAPATITGVIETSSGTPLPGVVVTLTGDANRITITNSHGQYRFDGVDSDNFYTVTPSLVNYRFSPSQRSFSLVGTTIEAVFTGIFESVPQANAIDTSEYFVRQQYVDFLGREPDQSGFEYWSGRLNQCGGDAACLRARRTDVAAAFFTEQEFQRGGSFVYRAYKALLGRQLSYAEFTADRVLIVEGPNLDATKLAYANAFVQRPEFQLQYQHLNTAESFVDAALQNIVNTEGVNLSSIRTDLIARYRTGSSLTESRASVVRDLADNPIFAQAVFNKVFVLMEYFGYLKRDPDPGGYAFWLNILENREPGNYRGMVCSFITSAEYQLRFSPIITRNNGECQQ